MRNRNVNVAMFLLSMVTTVLMVMAMMLFMHDMMHEISPSVSFMGVISTALIGMVFGHATELAYEELQREIMS